MNSLSLASPYLGSTANNQSYTIVPVAGYTRSLARKTGELVSDYSLAYANRVISVSGRTGDVTKDQLLTDLKTIDGPGSGLDADTVDGKHASDFVPAVGGLSQSASYLSMTNVSGNTCAELFTNTPPGATSIVSVVNFTDAPAVDWWMIESIHHNTSAGVWGTQTAHGWGINSGKVFERDIKDGVWSAWRRVISSTNSGNVLIGTDNDNGADKLQIGGSITASGAINSKNRQVRNFFTISGDSSRIQTMPWYKLGTFSNNHPDAGASARINLRTGVGFNHNRYQRYYGSIDLRWGNAGGVEVSAAFSEGNIPVGYTANSDASSVDVYLNLSAIAWAGDQSYEVEILNGYSVLTWQNLTGSNISGTPSSLVASNFVVVSTTNNVVIGSIVDNGIDKLQVNGNISSNGDKRAADIAVSTTSVPLIIMSSPLTAVGYLAFISYWNTSTGAQGHSVVSVSAAGVYVDINHDGSGCNVSFSDSDYATLRMKKGSGTVRATARLIQ
jgi:hypothetical protein